MYVQAVMMMYMQRIMYMQGIVCMQGITYLVRMVVPSTIRGDFISVSASKRKGVLLAREKDDHHPYSKG